MWIISTVGFFSVVQKPSEPGLTVRARARADLEALRDRYLPNLGDIEESADTDYRYRARASHAEVASALAAITTDVRYPNFKNEVARRQGAARAGVYHEVWAALRGVSEIEKR